MGTVHITLMLWTAYKKSLVKTHLTYDLYWWDKRGKRFMNEPVRSI